MKKIVLTYGIISGIIVTTLMLVGISVMQHKEDMSSSMLLGYTTMVISLSLIFFAVKSYRDNELGGMISIGKGFLIGLYITLIAGSIYAIGWDIYYRSTDEQFMQQYSDMVVRDMQKAGKSEAEISTQVEEMKVMAEYYKNPIVRFGFTIMEILPVGIIISLITALILRKKTTTDINPA